MGIGSLGGFRGVFIPGRGGWPNDEAYYVIRDAGAGISSAPRLVMRCVSCPFSAYPKFPDRGETKLRFCRGLKHVL